MEQPWNSVRIKFNVPREAADRLKRLIDSDNIALRDLGILAVQIDEDKVVKLSLASNDRPNNVTSHLNADQRYQTPTASFSSDDNAASKRNDTLTKLLERTTPSSVTSTPFFVNANKPTIHHRPPSLVLASTSGQQTNGQQNEFVNTKQEHLNRNLLTNKSHKPDESQLLVARPIQIQCSSSTVNSASLGNLVSASSINQQQTNHHQFDAPLSQQATLNNNVQTSLAFVNMQQQPLNQQLNKPIISNSPLNSKPNNFITLNTSNSTRIDLSPAQGQVTSSNSGLPVTSVTGQNVVQQIQLEYTPQQMNATSVSGVAVTNNLMASNIGSINKQQSYVRNPNIKIASAGNQMSINSNINQQTPIITQKQLTNHQLNMNQLSNTTNLPQSTAPTLQLTLNSELSNPTQTIGNCAGSSNVALTSPLLVNLLQSDPNDHYNSSNSSNNLTISNTLQPNMTNNNAVMNMNDNNATSSLKEPPAKKAKTKKTRKPKDKPPDSQTTTQQATISSQMPNHLHHPQLVNSTTPQVHQQMNIVNKILPENEMTKQISNQPLAVSVGVSPSNSINHPQYQYSNAFVNSSSIITIPSSSPVTPSTSGTSNSLQIQKQPVNNIVTSQFVSSQQQQPQNSCSFLNTSPPSIVQSHYNACNSNSTMIVNQIKMTNSDIVHQQHSQSVASKNNVKHHLPQQQQQPHFINQLNQHHQQQSQQPQQQQSQPPQQQQLQSQPQSQQSQQPQQQQQQQQPLKTNAVNSEGYVQAPQSFILNNQQIQLNSPNKTIVCSSPSGSFTGTTNNQNLASSAISSTGNYNFRKLSSLTNKESVPGIRTSNSNLIVQNATIVNSTVVNTSTITLNNLSSGRFTNQILPHKNSSDSFLNLPPLEEQNKTKQLMNPFTAQFEPMDTTANCSSSIGATTSISNSNSNSKNCSNHNYVNITTQDNSTSSQTAITGTSSTSLVNATSDSSRVLDHRPEMMNQHMSDTDSGISKSINDASSQSSSEISSVELLNNQDHHKLNESTLLDGVQSSLVNFSNESMIGDSTILKNKLTHDLLSHGVLDKNESSIERDDQLDDYFNTDISNFHSLNSLRDHHSLVPQSDGTSTSANNLLPITESSSNLLGTDHHITNHHQHLDVNDFLTTPDLNDIHHINHQSSSLLTGSGKLEMGDSTTGELVDSIVESNSIAGDHNYTNLNSSDHTYTNHLKRPCAFTNTSNSGTVTNNMCNNKIKKVNS